MICKVKKTIKYQNSIYPTDKHKIVPYYIPAINKGICKYKFALYPVIQYKI